MRTSATLYVSVRDEFSMQSFATSKEIAGPFVEAFEPIDLCTNSPWLAGFVRHGVTESQAVVVRKKREHYAKILADAIAKEIVAAMEANDTLNGYRKEPTK